MKTKNILFMALFLLVAGFVQAQAPKRFNYQAVARDNSGNHLANQSVGIQISIRQGTATGTVVYTERHTQTTSNIGLINLSIGGGTVTAGDINTINWAAGPYFVEIGMDPNGGTSFQTLGTQQLMSVPYALFAENSGTPGPAGPAGPAGPTGAAGANGVDGNDGASFLSGSGAPSSGLGNDGDTYIDLATGDTYLNTAGTWAATGNNLMGPAGANGTNGTNGTNGAAFLSGSGAPSSGLGNSGDTYIDLATGNTYLNNAGMWGATGNSLMGPAGATGAAGAAGPAGPAGPAGAVGPAGPAGSANISGTTNYLVKFTGATTGGNSQFRDDGTTASMGIAPSAIHYLYINRTQLTASGDGQSTVYGYRTRDSQNDGTSYSVAATNVGVRGYSFWGDLYSFGVGGFNYNDYTRCGGTIGAEQSGSYWGALGYKNSGSTSYGVYGTSAYASGTGFLPSRQRGGIGGGFFGDFVGSYSRGAIIGQMNAGELFASYNMGDEYTAGRQVELVNTGGQRTAAYTVTSPDVTVYKKGTAQMVNGSAFISFDKEYSAMLGETPVVTITPMGACNGVYIESVTKNGFTVKELNHGSSSVNIAWIAVGDRVDANTEGMPTALKNANFDNQLKEAMFDDSNKEENAKAMWWNGSDLEFGQMPTQLIPQRQEGGK
jgi:hypothetical protein